MLDSEVSEIACTPPDVVPVLGCACKERLGNTVASGLGMLLGARTMGRSKGEGCWEIADATKNCRSIGLLRKGVSKRGLQMATSVDPYGSLAMHCSADGSSITTKAVYGEVEGIN